MRKMRILRVNLDLLALFEKPTSAYDLFKHLSYSSYAGAHKQVRSFERLGLIALTESALNRKGTAKKLFVLTDNGHSLLRLFPLEARVQAKEES